MSNASNGFDVGPNAVLFGRPAGRPFVHGVSQCGGRLCVELYHEGRGTRPGTVYVSFRQVGPGSGTLGACSASLALSSSAFPWTASGARPRGDAEAPQSFARHNPLGRV